MDNEKLESYADKIKEIRNKGDMMVGCMNRMSLTDDREELFNMYAYLTLYAVDLYRLHCRRLFISEYGDVNPAE